MAYGLQVISEINANNVLIDGSEPFVGMYTLSSGTVNPLFNNGDVETGVLYDDGDVVLFKPTGTVASGAVFIVTGRTIRWTGTPLVFLLQFNIITLTGTAPSTIDYVVLRPTNKGVSTSETYGLQTKDLIGGYTVTTFDSRAFTTAFEVHIDNVWSTRFSHTAGIGTINNDEWYNTATLEWVSVTQNLSVCGFAFSNRATNWTDTGPFPNLISIGISHYGKQTINGNQYSHKLSDYTVRGTRILGN